MNLLVTAVLYAILFAGAAVLLGLTAYHSSRAFPGAYVPIVVELLATSSLTLAFSFWLFINNICRWHRVGVQNLKTHVAEGCLLSVLLVMYLVGSVITSDKWLHIARCQDSRKLCHILDAVLAFSWVDWALTTILLIGCCINIIILKRCSTYRGTEEQDQEALTATENQQAHTATEGQQRQAHPAKEDQQARKNNVRSSVAQKQAKNAVTKQHLAAAYAQKAAAPGFKPYGKPRTAKNQPPNQPGYRADSRKKGFRLPKQPKTPKPQAVKGALKTEKHKRTQAAAVAKKKQRIEDGRANYAHAAAQQKRTVKMPSRNVRFTTPGGTGAFF